MYPSVAPPAHILIVEDDPAIGDMLTLLLEEEGYDVTWCPSASAAVMFLIPTAPDTALPDLLLLDLQLGASSAVTLLPHLAVALPTVPPVIIISAAEEHVVDAAVISLGAVAGLRKPFAPDDLVRLVGATCAALRAAPAIASGRGDHMGS